MLASASASTVSSRSTYSAKASGLLGDGGDPDGDPDLLFTDGGGGELDGQVGARFVHRGLAFEFGGVDGHLLEGGVGDTEVGLFCAGAALEAAEHGDVGGDLVGGVLLAGGVAGALHL